MPLDQTFLARAESLFVPEMGTERVGPLLYQLVLMTRPRTLLEVGMGYTTLFLARAVQDLREFAAAESAGFAAKTAPYLERDEPLDERWARAAPALAAPSFYTEEYQPVFVAIDNLASTASSAHAVQKALRDLALDGAVTVLSADVAQASDLLPEGFAPIDFAWIDAWECLSFFENHWDDLSPSGGLLLMHYLMTYPEGVAVRDYIKSTAQLRPGEMELVNLFEPHKLEQNSITIVRKTSGFREPSYAHDGKLALGPEERSAAARAIQRVTASRRLGGPPRTTG